MKHALLLPLLLLGTVAAVYLENDAPLLDSEETQGCLSQDPEGSGEQEEEPALTEELIQSGGEQVKASSDQNAFEDETAMESDPSALDKNLQCPRPEDTIEALGSPGCKTCRYLLVQTHRTFAEAQDVCRRCYRGNLASIHNLGTNRLIRGLTSGVNELQVWIGATYTGWFLCKRSRWTDGTSWNFQNWASGQPACGRGDCVALCTRGGHWQRVPCRRQKFFICSF